MEPRVKDITSIMERYFPPELAEDWDNAGLQTGSRENLVQRVLVCLDLTEQILQKAEVDKANLIITHHPLLFKALKSINIDTPSGRMISQLIKNDITVYSAHTNLDAGTKGLNQLLAETMGLVDIQPLDRIKPERYLKLAVFVPAAFTESVRQAINEAGAGFIGNYSDCSFRTRGTGTFKPQPGTSPFIGTAGNMEEVEEYRLETIVPEKIVARVITAMKKVHPYEEVAYDLYPLANEGPVYSLGRTGRLETGVSLEEFALQVKNKLELDYVRIAGDLKRPVNKVAVVSGAGAGFINKAKARGMDVLVTGDLKYHEARDAQMSGLAVIDAGHQGTEEIMVPYITTLLENECRSHGYKVSIDGVKADQCIKTIG